jgi:hypothetical protein
MLLCVISCFAAFLIGQQPAVTVWRTGVDIIAQVTGKQV